jgi:hypothetical protein
VRVYQAGGSPARYKSSRLQNKRRLPDVIPGTAQFQLVFLLVDRLELGAAIPNLLLGPNIFQSAESMQAPSSRLPTVKARDQTRKPSPDAWTGPTSIVTFVRCLRLLDLDLLEDWPEITEDTFSTAPAKQNLQARIKCVEWSLYRLFELWSPSETRDVWRKDIQPSYFV